MYAMESECTKYLLARPLYALLTYLVLGDTRWDRRLWRSGVGVKRHVSTYHLLSYV